MCKLCDQYKAGKIDAKTVFKKLNNAMIVEMDIEHKANLMKHMLDASNMILAKEVPEVATDEEADREWQKNNSGD